MQEMAEAGLSVEERADGIATVTLDRGRVANALNPVLAHHLGRYFSDLATRTEIRVVLLQGAGRNFCSGFDLGSVDQITASVGETIRLQRVLSDIVVRMRRCPQPIIALVQGAASGAGMALALAADVRIATPDARLNVAMARIGLTGCDMGISYFLPRLVGPSLSAQLMMTGRFINAARAERVGLISEIVDAEHLKAEGRLLAEEMLRLSPSGLRLTKEGLNNALDAGSLEEVVALEDRGQVICIGQHMKEGVAAFLEKRPARFEPD